jgi:hypothetical protein
MNLQEIAAALDNVDRAARAARHDGDKRAQRATRERRDALLDAARQINRDAAAAVAARPVVAPPARPPTIAAAAPPPPQKEPCQQMTQVEIDAMWAGLAAKASARAGAFGGLSSPLSRERREPATRAAGRDYPCLRTQAGIDRLYASFAAELNATLPPHAWLPAGAPGSRGRSSPGA